MPSTRGTKKDGIYGTIARLKVKSDRVEALQRLTASYDDLEVPGFVGTHVYRMDADDTEYYLVVLFEDRESYRKNAEDPAQDRQPGDSRIPRRGPGMARWRSRLELDPMNSMGWHVRLGVRRRSARCPILKYCRSNLNSAITSTA